MAGIRGALSERFDYAPGQFKPKTVRTGAIFVALTSIFLFVIYTRPSVPLLSGGGQEVKAQFAFGANVRPGYTPVRVNGVEVGQVKDIERGEGGRGALVTVEFKKGSGVELKEDVTMALRWRTLLGRNLYVDVEPGSPSAPEWRGGTIPKTRTQDQVELDTTLEPLNARGRGALQTMITEFDTAFADPEGVAGALDSAGGALTGRPTGDSLGAALAAGGPSMKGGADGLPALRGVAPGQDLPKLVVNANRALGELSRDEVALGNLVTDGSTALAVTAAQRANLAATVNTAPATLRQTRATLVRLEDTLDEIDPLADELRPGLDRLATTANSTKRTLDVARPLLDDLRPTLNLLRPALTDLQTASTRGIPSFGSLNNTLKIAEEKIVPWLNSKDPATKRPNYQNIGPLTSHVGSAVSWGDRYGALANFEAAAGEDAFDSPCILEISNPDVSAQDKIKCDLFGAALTSMFKGINPKDLKLGKTASPIEDLKPYLSGKKKIPGLDKLLKSKGGR